MRIGGPLHASNEEYTASKAAMQFDAHESTIQASREELIGIKARLELPFLEFRSSGFFFLATSGMRYPSLFC
jgi:hypothetical protein